MSVAAERKLGQRIARDIFRDPDYIDDPVVGDYVQRIWQPLMAAATARGDIPPELAERFAWQVMLARDRSVNAFALPGGYMGVHLGLIAMVGNRDELASVLAHELSHVSQRHIARITSLQNQQAPWLLGAMILGALAARKNVDVASAVVTTAQAASIQNQLNFSRDMEREADRIGYQVLEQAQFNVQGFVGMFDKLALANRINDNGSFPYLRTHPLTSERIGDMQARLQLAPSKPVAASEAVALEHALIATRARLLADPSVDHLRSEVAQAQALLRASVLTGSAPASPTPASLTPASPSSTSPAPTSPASSTSTSTAKLRSALVPAQLYGGALAALKQRDLPLAQRLAEAALIALVARTAIATRSAGTASAQGSPAAVANPKPDALLAAGMAEQTVQLLQAEIALAQNNPAHARALVLAHAQKSPVARPVLLLCVHSAERLQSALRCMQFRQAAFLNWN
jgi:predicted Zn-dependent protease